MQTPYKLIKGYSVSFYGGAKNVNGHLYRAVIHLFEKKASSYLGCAYFHRNLKTMPKGDSQKANGVVYLHFTEDQYEKVLDILRNESPVYLNFVGKKWNVGSLNTAREPVGEGELG